MACDSFCDVQMADTESSGKTSEGFHLIFLWAFYHPEIRCQGNWGPSQNLRFSSSVLLSKKGFNRGNIGK